MTPRHVAIVGGGYSGTLQAIQLLRRGLSVTLIERADRVGRGIAYSTPYPDHLLNVCGSGMSAFPDEPDHFADWLGARDDFAERRRYGDYLEALLRDAAAEAGERFRIVRGEAVDVTSEGGAELVRLADGRAVEADAAVLSIGNLPPAPPRSIPPVLIDNGVYIADPWAGDFTAGLEDDETVLLVGTGLTAVDVALILESSGFEGRVLALSRRGMVPRNHVEPATPPPLYYEPVARCTWLIRRLREQAARIGWRAAVDQLRAVTQSLWVSASLKERQRFLRHLRPYWDVHRHRIAPAVAERIRDMVANGRLQFAAGRILATEPEGDHAIVTWRRRGAAGDRILTAARIVNCTGPEADIRRADEPLLRNLLAAGRIRPDDCRIGIDIDERGQVVGATGTAAPSLFAIGPMTRGALWEVVAVPDIRGQTEALADLLAV